MDFWPHRPVVVENGPKHCNLAEFSAPESVNWNRIGRIQHPVTWVGGALWGVFDLREAKKSTYRTRNPIFRRVGEIDFSTIFDPF